jgi:hypothetical protein
MAKSMDDGMIESLRERFETNPRRHEGVAWSEVEKRVAGNEAALKSLAAMEESGGEPDVVGRDLATGELRFCDCSAESPAGRRSLCYDRAALESRKEHRPAGSAVGMAESMGIELMTEPQYRALQELGEFDLKTSSWIATPSDVRGLDGALFCDRRFGRVFVYHNGAESYYSARGFRGCLRA